MIRIFQLYYTRKCLLVTLLFLEIKMYFSYFKTTCIYLNCSKYYTFISYKNKMSPKKP